MTQPMLRSVTIGKLSPYSKRRSRLAARYRTSWVQVKTSQKNRRENSIKTVRIAPYPVAVT